MKNCLYILCLSLLLASCGHDGFTADEKDRIGASGDGLMRVLTIDDRTDSLFLRMPVKQLTEEHFASELFGVLKERMLLTVQNPENEGVGIAAPQVGLSYALVTVQRLDKEGEPFEFYVNPSIVNYSEEQLTGYEGCLSIPSHYGRVSRSQAIDIVYNDPDTFLTVEEHVEGYTARIFQHEIDHLSGRLYIDLADEIMIE